jgi:hypothetical protein
MIPFFVAIACSILSIYRINLGWKSIQKGIILPLFVFFLIATAWFIVGDANPLAGNPVWLWIGAAAIIIGAIALTDMLLRRNPFPLSDGSLDYEYLQIDLNKVILHAHEPVSDQQKRLSRQTIEKYFRRKKPFLDPKFRLEDLGAAMHVNRTVISGFMNETYGMNFKRYVNRWRLREYRRLRWLLPMLAADSPKILTLSGFSDMRHYQRALDAENKARDETSSASDAENRTSGEENRENKAQKSLSAQNYIKEKSDDDSA